MKKGFTLLELLAVIIILAVIALIATPVILNVVEKSKKEALKDSAYGLINSARFYSYQYKIDDTVRFDIRDSVVSSEEENKITFQGKIENGIVLVNDSNEIALCVNEGEYSAYKNFKDTNVILADNKNCDIPVGYSVVYLAGESTIKEYTNQELTEIVQKLESRINELENNSKDTTPAGTVISYMASATAPEGYLSCDGSIYNISDYPVLAEAIKKGFGSYNYYGGDGTTTFAVPDLRGEFLRGTGTNGHANQGNGTTVGKHQDATGIPPFHSYSNSSGYYFVGRLDTGNLDASGGYGINNSDSKIPPKGTVKNVQILNGKLTDTTITSSSWTTRPTNTSVLYCIKY